MKRKRRRFLLIKQEIPCFLFNKQSLQVNWTGLKSKKDRHFCLISLFQKHSNSPETIWLLFKFFVPCNSMSIWPHSQNSIITFAWQLTIFTYNTWIIIDETRKGSSHCSWGPNAEARMYPKCKLFLQNKRKSMSTWPHSKTVMYTFAWQWPVIP